MPPSSESSAGFFPLWRATRELFLDTSARVGTDRIYELWSAPPFGVKRGIQPVILAAFLLAHQANIAVYKDGMFIPRLTDFEIDECLQDPSRFSLRWVAIDEDKSQILRGISKLLAEIGERAGSADPLEAARGLVSVVFSLPDWARRMHGLPAPPARPLVRAGTLGVARTLRWAFS